jgi:hypothetical protein
MSAPVSPAAAGDGSTFAPLGGWLSGWIGGSSETPEAGDRAGEQGACGLPPAADATFWRRDAAVIATDALALVRLYDAPREAELQRLRAAAEQSAAVLNTAAAAVEQRRTMLTEVRPSRGRMRDVTMRAPPHSARGGRSVRGGSGSRLIGLRCFGRAGAALRGVLAAQRPRRRRHAAPPAPAAPNGR